MADTAVFEQRLAAAASPGREGSLKTWWRSLDKPLLGAIGSLILIGVVLAAAAGPVAAFRKGIADPLHFVERQYLFLGPALLCLGFTSLLAVRQVRAAGIVLAGMAFGMMLLTLILGETINGANRWLSFAGFSLQPSEFFKPGFALMASLLLAEQARTKDFPGGMMSAALFAAGAIVLLLQPDFGQLFLLTAIWGTVFFVAGWNWLWIGGLGTVVSGILAFGYTFAPHFRSRIDRFFDPSSGDTYQVDMALKTVAAGGAAGYRLNDAQSVKNALPDAHTDFIFAVAAEEFGFLLGAIIIGLFATIAYRCLKAAFSTEDVFCRCAILGLAAHLCFQAFINIGVTLSVLPAKGMTLPFISYGGSSLIGAALSAGFLLALTRRQPA
ncbi:putative cell division protein ftsW [Parvularcula bermudensis HTCC2503]|uniref:Probable peptidoglycan glycosyltransferase FtsW n=1 Tax=Parvularcula bermudensis (strain ATCC BAA-594 / HTCC2503 / KCTC 12087) TaxID=314260 RepID=E0TDT0_PARBH|nr:FtsW/RodA/SpoVE family cell cycle protein [Parvularcula bermudensis]ADM09996.1 putative cell division protein ftsW [Parvularcula bermudensis HTCC2503]